MTLEQYIQNLNLAICTDVTNDLVPTNILDLNQESINEFAKKTGLDFVPKKENGNVCFANNNDELRDDFKQFFTTVDFLDYIYAVSFSVTFKKISHETFSTDFSQIPFPIGSNDFWKLVKLGTQLRELHLHKSPFVENNIAQFSIEGINVAAKPRFEISPVRVSNSYRATGKIFINQTQYFDNVPEVAWNFHTDGFQPAQKWLEDKKGKILEFDDIRYYQKIIVALTATDRIVKEINKIEIQ